MKTTVSCCLDELQKSTLEANLYVPGLDLNLFFIALFPASNFKTPQT